MPLRDIASYPAQEPFTEIGGQYHLRVQELAKGIEGENIAYGADPYQEVAVFEAGNPDGRVLVFMHGGGWTNGYKEWMAFMAPPLNERGITFVSLGYRLAPGVTWPDGVHDAAAGVAWIHAHIARHGGDPDRLILGGHSAGGHHASWLAVRGDWQEKAGVPLDIVKGAVPVSGVYDFTEGNGMPVRPRFLGTDTANDIDASPLLDIQRTPPFLVAWGDRDFPHLMAQGERMAAALVAAGGQVDTLVLQDCDHLGASYACGQRSGPWLTAFDKWTVARHL